jgi:hypothetical protein
MKKAEHITFKQWYLQASAEDIRTLADMSGTSVPYIQQIVGEHRKPSADLSLRLYQSMVTISLTKNGRAMKTDVASLGSISETCANCPFYLKCGKSIITD